MAGRPLRLELYPTPELLEALDRWRAQQPGIPQRADAGRRLLEEMLTIKGVLPAKATAPKRAARRQP
jgi:hypothetical protein